MDIIGELRRFRMTRNAGDTCALLSELGGHFGLPYYVVSSYPTPGQSLPMPFWHTNWPEDWAEWYAAEDMTRYDPVLQAVAIVDRPITATQVRTGAAGVLADAHGMKIFDKAAEYGIHCGFFAPIFGPSGLTGLVSLAGEGPDPDEAGYAALTLVAHYGYRRLREFYFVAQRDDGLTRRELQVLGCASRGQRDEAIANRLGIAVRTVRFHFGNAQRKLGAQTRAETLARAVQQNLLL